MTEKPNVMSLDLTGHQSLRTYNESLYYFDIIKFIVISLIVCVHHIKFGQQLLGLCPFVTYIAENGHSLVNLMFLMSGILYYFTYHKRISNGETDFFKFISKKYRRFFWIAALTTTLTVFNTVVLGSDIEFVSGSLTDYLVSIVFFGRSIFGLSYLNNAPLWFICNLMYAYGIAYFVSKVPQKYFTYLCGMISLTGILMSKSSDYPFFNKSLGECLFPFFLGLLTGFLLEQIKDRRKIRIAVKVFCLFLVILYAFTARIMNWESIQRTILLFLPFLVLLYDVPLLNRAFSGRIFRNLGKVSFYMYVWNWPILQFLLLLIPVWLGLDESAPVMMGVSFVCHVSVGVITLICKNKVKPIRLPWKAKTENGQ